jgi:hypothetical protein
MALTRVAQIVTGVVDQFVGSIVLADGQLGVAGCGGDHPRAHRLAELDRRNAHAAGCAEYQQRLAGLELGAILERVIRSAVGEDERRGWNVVHGVGHRHQTVGIDRNLFGEAAVRAGSDHAVTRLHAAHALAQLLHHAGNFPARRNGSALTDRLNNQRMRKFPRRLHTSTTSLPRFE